MKISKVLYVIFILLIGTKARVSAQNTYVAAVHGVLDLRNQPINDKIELTGNWLFYWNQLINPTDTTAIKDRLLVEFPFKWSGYTWRGKKLPAFGYGTYRLKILLPQKHGELKLAMPDVYSAYRLYINKKLVSSNGKVTTSRKGFEAHWEYHAVDLPSSDTINITLQVANFIHSKGGISKPIFIGPAERIDLARHRAEGIDLMLTGCLLMGGLFFLGLYLLGSRDKAILLFALFSIVYSYRIIGTDNYVLHTLLPNINWYITARLEYMSLFSGIGLFGLYTLYLYPADVNRRVVNIINGICFSFTLMTLFSPPWIFTQLVNPFLAVMLFCLVYIPYVYSKAWRNNRPGSVYALMSAFALMSVFAISLFHYWALIPPLQLISFLGYIAFFFLQSLVLAHRVSFVLKKARAEAEQGLKVKSEFLSTMSHEIRTPLNSVIGMSHLLLKNEPRKDQIEHLNVMLFSANNLLAIVNDVLDYNKIEAGKITFESIEMDLAALARNVVGGLQTVAHDKDITLRLDFDKKLQHKLLGDPTRLSQVITNLVHNAIKFTPSGEVVLGIEVKEQTETTATLMVFVKDTGIGIPRGKQKLIFERFTQADSSISRSFGGTGLGLAISKKILELQESSLQLISEEGVGSVFYFIKTFEKAGKISEAVNVNVKPDANDKLLSGISILLVDDNPMNVLVAQTYLKRWGATTDVATNGQEALDKLDTSKHRLVLMDLQMPVMDGYESTKRMRLNGINIPIIALTANLPKDVEDEAYKTGFDDIVMKPFLPDELHSKVLHHVFKQEHV
ncbi:ATP-binding protein [Mucilaginibacter gossypii]|uniref:response regulator n=1 Tax=Mucilaginibacter gossypii TaxID=551996 RepID=UPI000DCB887A|nr:MULTISPECIES: response regulator [Mucilaginibacter]QTE38419.1 ATP-binding protein [Mucilaginibacter gossypii]RAV59738.1 ATPase [Mucilaginibacter rubeus]